MKPRRVRFVTESVARDQSPRNFDATVVIPNDNVAAVVRGATTSGEQCAPVLQRLFPECYRAAVTHTAEMRAPPGAELLLRDTFARLNAEFLAVGEADATYRGQVATACAIAIDGDEAVIAHVGDCRAFVLTPDGDLYLCTREHTLARELEDMGRVVVTDAVGAPLDAANVLVSAIGMTSRLPRLDIDVELVHDHSVFLLCTRGVTDAATRDELRAATITARADPFGASAQLRRLALSRKRNNDASWVIASVTT